MRTEIFSDYKSPGLRGNFLKSGKGRKWLDPIEDASEPA